MAGHIQDRWYKTEPGQTGKDVRVRSTRYGTGLRYRARYVGPDGTERSKSFPDRQKRQAEEWLSRIEADMSRGHYLDPRTARITFREYAEKWLAALTSDLNTRTSVNVQIRKHAIPYIGTRPMDSFQPQHIREWLSALESAIPATSYRRVIFASVSAIFTAAVDDQMIARNPCSARSVTTPQRSSARLVPWSADRVFAVRAGLLKKYQAMVDVGAGCGLRQGEIFGLPVDAIDEETGWLHVGLQVKPINGRLVFAPPKRGKERDVPLPGRVATALQVHMEEHPPALVTLPWLRPDGEPLTRLLVFTRSGTIPVRSSDFNVYAWKPALVAAGVIEAPQAGARHQAAREHGMHALRHFYASVLLDAGESVKALSSYLGHSDPGFTLRVYTHLMPSSEGRTRRALDKVYETRDPHSDCPQTAQVA